MTLIPSIPQYGAIKAVFNYWTAGADFMPSGMIRRMDGIEINGIQYQTQINHVGRRFVLSNGISICSESHVGAGVQLTPYDHILRAIGAGKVIRYHEVPLMLNQEDKLLLWERHIALHGKPYDKGLILAYYAWIRATRKHRKLRSMASRADNGKYTCNELFVHAGRGVDPHIPQDADVTWTPEYCFYRCCHDPSEVVLSERRFSYAKDYGEISFGKDVNDAD